MNTAVNLLVSKQAVIYFFNLVTFSFSRGPVNNVKINTYERARLCVNRPACHTGFKCNYWWPLNCYIK